MDIFEVKKEMSEEKKKSNVVLFNDDYERVKLSLPKEVPSLEAICLVSVIGFVYESPGFSPSFFKLEELEENLRQKATSLGATHVFSISYSCLGDKDMVIISGNAYKPKTSGHPYRDP